MNIRLVLCAVLLLGVVNAVQAETVRGDVRAGRTTQVLNYFVYDRARCARTALPEIGKSSAENGKLKTRISNAIPEKGSCKGKSFKSLGVYYTPKPGFRGKDKGFVTLIFPRYVDGTGRTVKKVKFILNVK